MESNKSEHLSFAQVARNKKKARPLREPRLCRLTLAVVAVSWRCRLVRLDGQIQRPSVAIDQEQDGFFARAAQGLVKFFFVANALAVDFLVPVTTPGHAL